MPESHLLRNITENSKQDLREMLDRASAVPAQAGQAANPNLTAFSKDMHLDQEAQARQARDTRRSTTAWEAADAAASSTTTAHLYRALKARTEGYYEDPVEDYSPSLDDYYETLNQFGLVSTEHNRRRLMQANSPDQMLRWGQELKDAQEAQAIVGDRWAINLAVHGLDLVENLAMLGAGVAMGPAGVGAALSARAARFAGAAAQVGALGGAMYAGRQAGADYDAVDVLAAAGIGLPLVYLGTRGQYARLYRRDLLRAQREVGWEARKAAKGETLDVGMPNAEKAPTDAPKRSADDFDPVQDLHARAEAELAADAKNAAAANRQRFFNNERKIQDKVNKSAHTRLIDNLTERLTAARDVLRQRSSGGGWFFQLPHTKGYMNARVHLENARAEVRAELAQAEKHVREAVGDKQAHRELVDEVRQLRKEVQHLERDDALLDYMDISREEFLSDVKAAKEAYARNPAQEVQELEYALRQAKNHTVPQNAMEADMLDLQIARNEVYPEYPVHREVEDVLDDLTATAHTEELGAEIIDRVADTIQQQKGSADVRPGIIAQAYTATKSLVSEHFKLTKGIPEVERFLSRLIDDPLGRAGLQGDTAAARLAIIRRQAKQDLFTYLDVVDEAVRKRTGQGKMLGGVSFTKKFQDARDVFEDQVASVMLQRNTEHMQGKALSGSPDADVMRAVEALENVKARALQRAKDAGLKGFENIEAAPGYFYRNWSGDKIHKVARAEGDSFVKSMLRQSILRGSGGYTADEAKAVANAIFTRAKNKSIDARTDFMGQLGQQETDSIIEILKSNGTAAEVVRSIEHRLKAQLDEAGKSKYAKQRIDMDMTLSFRGQHGTYRMQDLIDSDLSRMTNNYLDGMSGRTALAHAGIGGDVHGVSTYVQQYAELLQKHGVEGAQRDSMLKTMQDVMSAFTGTPREGAHLGPGLEFLKSTSTAAQLGATGLWQVGEGAVLAMRHGMLAATTALLREMPVVKHIMNLFKDNPQLIDEWEQVMQMSFTDDTRIRPWLRQYEQHYAPDNALVRGSKYFEQGVQVITAQRWVQRLQTRASLNLHLGMLYKAATGDAKALKHVLGSSDLFTPDVLTEIKAAARLDSRGRITSMGLDSLSDQALLAVEQGISRLQDTAILQNRPGWGNSFQYSAIGKLLGQFTSFVTLANNVVMRRNFYQHGIRGVAHILAFQFPSMLMAAYVNEIRRGEAPDLDDPAAIRALAWKALTYSSTMGILGDITGAIRGDSRSVALLSPLEAPGKVRSAVGNVAQGDYGNAAADVIGAARAASIVGAFPGIQALQSALQK